jgi:hypothetical protein
MASLSAEVSENHPQVRAQLAEVFGAWSERIEALLRRAGNRLPQSTDHTALAQLVVCTMEGAVLGTRLNHSLAPFDAVVDQLKTYFDLLDSRAGVPAAVPAHRRSVSGAQPQAADWRSW